MMMLTKQNRSDLPELYSQDSKGDEAIAYVKFFRAGWTWYATEFDGEDRFFGLVFGFDTELGYFSLAEFEEFNRTHWAEVERDRHFTPKTLREIKDHFAKYGYAL